MHGTIHRPVWALAIICASCAGPYQKENRYYRCGFPDGDPDVHNVGDACIPNANATEATSQCACTKRCEEKKANSPDNHPIHELDCNLVTATDLTEPSIACTPPDQDLLTECVEDPPTPMYRCLGPIADSCTVDEGAVETNWPLEIAYIDICKQPGEDLDDVHNRCRQQCEDMFAEFEDDIGGSCDIDQNKCVGLAYPQPVFDAEGECMASEMAPDPKGEWMENLAWPGDDGIPTSRPLACRYATDCCTAYGREACDNLNLGLAGRRPVAEKASTLRGTLTLVPSRGSGVVVDVEGEVTFSARSCANANGTCPLYIEQLGLRMLRASGPVDVEGVSTRSEGEGIFRQLLIVPSGSGREG